MWNIIPLDLGTVHNFRRNIFPGETGQERIGLPNPAWLLIDEKRNKKCLVEAGCMEDDKWICEHHHPYEREREDQYLIKALEKHHVAPEDISYIVLTHLHWDHAYGPLLLPDAKVYVQGAELRQAVDPFPREKHIYEIDIKERLPFFFGYYHRMELLEGDCQIDDDLSVTMLPGHTAGEQGVLINTPGRQFLVASDLVNQFDQGPTGTVYDLDACHASVAKIKAMDVQVLPSHDWRMFDLFK